jgi:hypothetical protein
VAGLPAVGGPPDHAPWPSAGRRSRPHPAAGERPGCASGREQPAHGRAGAGRGGGREGGSANEEKEEAKKASKKKPIVETENVVVIEEIDIIDLTVNTGCIEILKSGQNKGKPCGCKKFLDDLCNRHFKIKNGIVMNNI